MPALLDIDQLRTFIAIADTGSFTRAAEVVHKTQSAVSMQMKRLEERVGKPVFTRDGRANRLTEEGERLLDYARRIVKLSAEAVHAFSDEALAGVVRLGIPDDYADRYLPEILARFSRSNPLVEVTVICEPSHLLIELVETTGELDMAIVTYAARKPKGEVIRQEPLLWVTSARSAIHEENPLPLAIGTSVCEWRELALDRLGAVGRSTRVLYQSCNFNAIGSAVLAGLAVSVLPEAALRPGMRILGAAEGFPSLPPCRIALVRSPHSNSPQADALADHIVASLDNLSEALAAAE